MHRSLEGIIRALMPQEDAQPNQWYRFVPAALAALRQTTLSNLPVSSHEPTFVQEPTISGPVILKCYHTNHTCTFWSINRQYQQIGPSYGQSSHPTTREPRGEKAGDWVFTSSEPMTQFPTKLPLTKMSLSSTVQTMMVVIPGTNNVMCKLCGFNSKLKSTTKRHVIAKHTNIRYPCQICPKSLTQEGMRVTHYKRAHGVSLTASQIREMARDETLVKKA